MSRNEQGPVEGADAPKDSGLIRGLYDRLSGGAKVGALIGAAIAVAEAANSFNTQFSSPEDFIFYSCIELGTVAVTASLVDRRHLIAPGLFRSGEQQ